jgi:hypothetical protein
LTANLTAMGRTAAEAADITDGAMVVFARKTKGGIQRTSPSTTQRIGPQQGPDLREVPSSGLDAAYRTVKPRGREVPSRR